MSLKKIALLVSIVFLGISSNVKAKEIFYYNDNGVNLSKEEYNFITKMLWEGYQKTMTINDYNYFFSDGISDDIEVQELNQYELYGTSHTTANKSLKISKANYSTYSLIVTNATWINSPTIRSYDVIGAYLDNVSLMDTPVTTVTSSEGKTYFTEISRQINGFGVSVKLPTSANNIIVTQSFKVSGNGHIYASYQHAKKTISKANSQKYSISLSGYGNVFLFNDSVKSYYDGMGGVDISV